MNIEISIYERTNVPKAGGLIAKTLKEGKLVEVVGAGAKHAYAALSVISQANQYLKADDPQSFIATEHFFEEAGKVRFKLYWDHS